ncbi:MAG: hypothetical protein ACP5U1_16120 [Desulfomonilaceae bacterium]
MRNEGKPSCGHAYCPARNVPYEICHNCMERDGAFAIGVIRLLTQGTTPRVDKQWIKVLAARYLTDSMTRRKIKSVKSQCFAMCHDGKFKYRDL